MKISAALLTAIATLGFVTPAAATTFFEGSPHFQIETAPGEIDAILGNNAQSASTFTDTYQFTVPYAGEFAGSLTTAAPSQIAANFLAILTVTFNGTNVPVTLTKVAAAGGIKAHVEQTADIDIELVPGAQNDLVITYKSNGGGNYGGQFTFLQSAVPEPATWATFLLGFGFIGFAARRRVQPRLAAA